MKKLLLLVMLLTSTAVWGMDEKGTFSTVGPASCGEFVALREKEPNPDFSDPVFLMSRSHALGWIAGFITGFNWQAPNTHQILGNTHFKGAVLWLENYCRSNPLSDLSRGMQALVAELYPRRHKTAKEAGY